MKRVFGEDINIGVRCRLQKDVEKAFTKKGVSLQAHDWLSR